MSETDEALSELKHLESDAQDSEVRETPRSPDEYIDSPDPSEIITDARSKPDVEDITNPVSQDGKPFASIEGELDFEDETENSAIEKSVSGKKKQISDEIGLGGSKGHDSEEEGLCTPEKKNYLTEKKDHTGEGEDDGECTDDDQDLEEGELKEENSENTPKPAARQICKFYNRNQCFYGNVCRFLHLNFDHRGNYNMFATTPRNYSDGFEAGPHAGSIMGPSNISLGMMNHRTRTAPDFIPPPLPQPPPEPPMESAWERGLREAKELVKKANRRKEEPDFEQKRLNLSLVANEKNTDFTDKENESLKSKKKRSNESHFKYDPHDAYDNDYDSRTHSGGRYENFEIRYTDRSGDRGRPRMRRLSHERDKVPKFGRNDARWRDDRLSEVQARSRPEESFFDPWRRSKSPKANRHSRSRSFSSVSSYTYSSRSSYSYSNSSSRSSCSSSRSPSVQQKRKISTPPNTGISPKTGANKNIQLKKKPGVKRASSSRSRSISRTHSVSRSRSSRSISMDSVSSASSSISHSSSGSGSLRHRNTHVSILRKQEEKSISEQIDLKPTSSSLYPEFTKINKFEKTKIDPLDDDRDPLEESFQNEPMIPFPSLQHLLPNVDKPKEPVKPLPKPQIKLTLLNKNPQNKIMNTLPKKELLDINKPKPPDDQSKMGVFNLGVKRPLSPPAVVAKPPPVIVPKKSPSSRRDELLKQLKAVEDAIARKRAKFF